MKKAVDRITTKKPEIVSEAAARAAAGFWGRKGHEIMKRRDRAAYIERQRKAGRNRWKNRQA